jgi:hypothetical protein
MSFTTVCAFSEPSDPRTQAFLKGSSRPAASEPAATESSRRSFVVIRDCGIARDID